jgi:hypothetical protein
MGQAKNRGPFEVRQAEGEAKRKAAAERRKAEIAAFEASLTPEQRRSRRQFQMLMTMSMGVLASSMRR